MPKSKTSKKKKTAKGGTGPSADVPADVVPTSELVAEAEAFAEQFDYDNAVRVLCQALTQEPDVPQTLEMLADMLMSNRHNLIECYVSSMYFVKYKSHSPILGSRL